MLLWSRFFDFAFDGASLSDTRIWPEDAWTLLADNGDASSGLGSSSFPLVDFKSLGLHALRSELLTELDECFFVSFLAPSFVVRNSNSLFAPSWDVLRTGPWQHPSKALTYSVSIMEEAGLYGESGVSSSCNSSPFPSPLAAFLLGPILYAFSVMFLALGMQPRLNWASVLNFMPGFTILALASRCECDSFTVACLPNLKKFDPSFRSTILAGGGLGLSYLLSPPALLHLVVIASMNFDLSGDSPWLQTIVFRFLFLLFACFFFWGDKISL